MKKNILIISTIVAAIIGLSSVYVYTRQFSRQKNTSPLSEKLANIPTTAKTNMPFIYSTAIVSSISGEIDKVEGNMVWVNTGGNNATASADKVYKVSVSDKTDLIYNPSSPPYLFQPADQSNARRIGINDIKPRQLAIITVANTEGTEPNTTHNASLITVTDYNMTVMNGTVNQIENNTLYIKQLPLNASNIPTPPPDTEIKVAISENTEISRLENGVPQKLTIGDVKAGSNLIIWAKLAPGSDLEALRIEPK